MPVTVGDALSIEDVVAAARGEPVELSSSARGRMERSRAVVDRKVEAGETVYGVTTGFGSLANVRLRLAACRSDCSGPTRWPWGRRSPSTRPEPCCASGRTCWPSAIPGSGR